MRRITLDHNRRAELGHALIGKAEEIAAALESEAELQALLDVKRLELAEKKLARKTLNRQFLAIKRQLRAEGVRLSGLGGNTQPECIRTFLAFVFRQNQ